MDTRKDRIEMMSGNDSNAVWKISVEVKAKYEIVIGMQM